MGRWHWPDVRMPRLLQKVQKENARLKVVRAHSRMRAIQTIAPIIRQESASSRCSTIVDRSAIANLGQAKDITFALMKAIDKNVPPFPADTIEKMPFN
jgi:Skp family chaperone for outer membrane proteins